MMHSGAPRTTQDHPKDTRDALKSTPEHPAAPRKHPAATRRHPKCTQGPPGGTHEKPETPRRHPGGTQETPRGHPDPPRNPETILSGNVQKSCSFPVKWPRIPISYESGEGDMHCNRSLRTKMSRHSARPERRRRQGPFTNTVRTPYR